MKNSALTSTGIVPFMERYSNSTREVAQEGRRGALMLSISVAHPDDVSRQPDGGVILTDTDGIRYRIPSAAGLDPRSQRLLERGL